MSRALWYESHLFADRAGRQARSECERLGSEVHERILRHGDRLAHSSVAVAQQFYRRAAAVWRTSGDGGFRRWVDIGASLIEPEQPNRDAALIYFGVSSGTVERAGFERLRVWADCSRQISAHGRKLGAAFLEGTAPLIDRLDLEAISSWSQAGLGVIAEQGWKGELLARSLFALGAQVLPQLEGPDLDAWVGLNLVLAAGSKQSRGFEPLPDGFTALKGEDRSLLLSTARAVAELDAGAGRAVYTALPAAIRRVHTSLRPKLLRALERAGAVAAKVVAEIAPVVGALLRDVPRPQRQPALDLLLRVADEFPLGVVALLRSLPVAYEDAEPPVVADWVVRGLEIARDNSDAGVAYFGLESRTSRQILHSSSTAAGLNDVQNVLRKYIQMLSGEPVSVRAAELAQLRAPIEEFPLEEEVALPIKVDRFKTHEDNCRLYRLLAAQLAGRRLMGTYDSKLAVDGLFPYLRDPEKPEILEELFTLVEAFRVSNALLRVYPGLRREQRELSRQALVGIERRHEPPPAARLDYVLLWLWSEQSGRDLPSWLGALADVVEPCVQPLRSPAATVDDSLTIAQELLIQLSGDNRSRRAVELAELAFERMAGDAVLDMYMEGDEGPSFPGESSSGPGSNDHESKDDVDVELALEPEQEEGDGGAAMSVDELQRLIDSGADLKLKQGQAEGLDGLGLYISDLLGKLPQQTIEQFKQLIGEGSRIERAAPRRWIERRANGAAFYYDEWDYHIRDYRARWCRLLEVAVDGDSGEFFHQTLTSYGELIPEIRRQFQRIRPEMYRIVRGLEDGEDFDLNAVIDARVDRRANQSPSPRVYVARTREERDVATLFLIDMSASTDEPITLLAGSGTPPDTLKEFRAAVTPAAERVERAPKPRRIIDLTKEALVVMAEALEEIGDSYAIYGFSGHGRNNVEFYLVKSFKEALSTAVKGRIGALEPKRSTRMGTALRHATEKMASVSARSRHMILLSDGFPQDFDYGQDRRSNVYGLRDTTIALREAEAAGIVPFCITVDKGGHDYLREMCDESRYMVIDDIASLPHELPKIYQRIVTA